MSHASSIDTLSSAESDEECPVAALKILVFISTGLKIFLFLE